MAKPKSQHIKLQALLLAILPLLAIGGCVNDNDVCPPADSDEEDLFHLQFAVSTHRGDVKGADGGAPETRAADIDGEVHGCAAENYINIEGRDLQFYLFDGERKFLQILDLNDVKEVFTEPDYSLYTFHAPVVAQYFKDNINTTFSFYIMALANGVKMGMIYPVPIAGETIEDVVGSTQRNDASSLLTVKPQTSFLFDAANNSVNENEKQFFPMAGLQKFTISGPELSKASEAQPYNISANGKEINMLRSMVKIEVIDHINFLGNYSEEYANDENRIAKVEINGIMNAGCILPGINEWTNSDADETQQVDNPTIPTGAVYQAPHPINSDNSVVVNDDDMTNRVVIEFKYDSYATQMRSDKCPVYSGYLYEYSLASLTDAQTKPYLRITTRGRIQGNETSGSRTIPVPVAEYENGAPKTPMASLLRNHIYRFQIDGINKDKNVSVQWTVCPMDDVDVDIPAFD